MLSRSDGSISAVGEDWAGVRSWETEWWGDGSVCHHRGPEADDERVHATIGPEEAEEELFNMLVSMKQEGSKMTAKAVCLLCYWIAKLAPNHAGRLSQLARKPGTGSGKYSQHYDKVLKGASPSEGWYRVRTALIPPCGR